MKLLSLYTFPDLNGFIQFSQFYELTIRNFVFIIAWMTSRTLPFDKYSIQVHRSIQISISY